MIRSIATIFAKDLMVMLRGNRAFSAVVLIVGVTGVGLLIFWASASALAYQDISSFSRLLFYTVAVIEMIGFGLISPVVSASIVASERERDTLDLLTCTGISPFQMLAGKWLASIVFQLMLMLALAPLLSIVYQLGGIGWDEYALAGGAIALTLLTYGMVGLACSCRFRKTMSAIVATMAIILFLVAGLPMLLGFLAQLGILDFNSRYLEISSPVDMAFWCVSPFTLWVLVANEISRSAATSTAFSFITGVGSPLITHAIIQISIFLVSARLAWHWLVKVDTAKAAPAKAIIDKPEELAKRRRRFPYYLIDPQRRAQAIKANQNPVFVLEQRVGSMARPQRLIRFCYLGAFASFLLIPFTLGNPIHESLRAVGPMALTLVIFLIPLFIAPAITREHEAKTMDLLATTLLTPRRIVAGKFRISMRVATILCASLLALPVLMRLTVHLWPRFSTGYSASPWEDVIDFVRYVPTLLAFLALNCAAALLCSSVARRTLTAVILAYLFLTLLQVGPFLLFFAGEFGEELANAFGTRWNFGDETWHKAFEWGAATLGALTSPILYSVDARDFPHPFVHYRSWAQTIIHTSILAGMTYGLLRLTMRRLERSVTR